MITGTRAPISILLADSNPLVLSAMARIFENDPRFSLVGTAANAEDFVSLLKTVPVQVGIVEWDLPQIGGARLLETLRAHARASPASKIPRIVVYGQETDSIIRLALGAGAAGFAPRSMDADNLLSICISVAKGKMIFPFIDTRAFNRDPVENLSQRERMILCALAKGLTNRELAKELEISGNTVKFHLSNLYEKLGVKNRARAIAFFYASELSENNSENDSAL